MTDKIALGLGIFVIGAFVVDYFFLGGNLPVFLGQKGSNFSEWLAFWR
jgi:hypothetical protein